MLGADLARDAQRVFVLARGQARAHCGHADRARAERAVRRRQHGRAVDAAGIADQHRAGITQQRDAGARAWRRLRGVMHPEA